MYVKEGRNERMMETRCCTVLIMQRQQWEI